MRDVAAIRLENLKTLIKESGGQTALAGLAESSAVYMNQLVKQAVDKKSGRPREVGDEMARRLENACGKPLGWMDHDHAAADRSRAIRDEFMRQNPCPSTGATRGPALGGRSITERR